MRASSTLLTALTLTTAMWAVQAHAQSETASPLLGANGFIREDTYVMPPPTAADKKYDVPALAGPHLKNDYMMAFVNISRKSRDAGDKYWGRIAGTKYEQMASQYMQDQFKKLGLTDIRQQDFALEPQWFPTDWSVTASGAGQNLTFPTINPAVGSQPTPAGGLSLPIVWVGAGTAADMIGRDVKGKAVLILSDLQPGNMGNSVNYERSVQRVIDAGAAAIIVIWGGAGNQAVWQGLGRGIGSNGINTPGFYMGYKDGKALRDLIGTGQPVTIKMNLKTEMRPNLKSVSAYGTLKGTTDENIVIMAHMDGYYDAALDNGSGLAATLGLAEYYSKIPQAQRRRNIIFIGTAGHHINSPNAKYMHEHKTGAGSFINLDKTALMISPEHISFSDFYKWNERYEQTNQVSYAKWAVWGSDKLRDVSLKTWSDYGIGLTGIMDTRASGEMGQVAHDAPSIEIIRSPEWKHTNEDVPEVIPAIGIERTAKAYAKIIDQVNTMDLVALQPQQKAAQK